MAEFVERVKRFEAKQFLGGQESYEDVRAWLKDTNITAMWITPQTEAGCDNDTGELLVLIKGDQDTGHGYRVRVDSWIVFEKLGFFRSKPEILCDEDFQAVFRPAKEDD